MRTALFAAVAMTVAACARLATPHAPMVTTPDGRRCVRECQSLHSRCVSRVNRETEESYLRFANPQLGSCNKRLGGCYAICPN